MTNLEIALRYLEQGISVIPVWSPEMVKTNPPKPYIESLEKKLLENSRSDHPRPEEEVKTEHFIKQCKTPLIRWTEYQGRLPTKEEVHHWFTIYPLANVGIITGKISNIVVFDLDSEHAYEYGQKQGGFPDTPKVKTAKGHHIYMKHPGFEIRNSVNKKLDIDIRCDGGYVVAPLSIHGSGHVYQWEEGLSIFEIEPAECTSWMIEYLESIARNDKPCSTKKDDSLEKAIEEAAKVTEENNHYVNLLKDGCSQGERNDKATKLIGHLLKTGLKGDEAWELVKMWNQRNSPPLDESELRRTFESVRKLESQNQKKQLTVSSFLDSTDKILREYDQNYLRIPFGGKELSVVEKRMNGGLVGGRLYILGGIPSSGKTVLANNIADNICSNDHPVLFFSYDDGNSELRYRSFARFSEYSIEDFNNRTLNKDNIKRITESPPLRKILPRKYVVQEMIPIEKWENLIEKVKREQKKAPVIIIDYLRKLRSDQRISDERLRVDDILSKLTDMAKKYNVPIVAISELARDSYKLGQRLSMASFKESGTIEFEASWLGILAAVEETKEGYTLKHNWERIIEQDGNVDLIVFKCKRGTGMTGKIPLKVDKEKMTVKDRKDHSGFDTTTATKKSKKFG